MNHPKRVSPDVASSVAKRSRRATNVSLDRVLMEEAKALGINISRACEAGLESGIARARRERWLAENMDALEASNVYVETHGLPLADLRLF